MNEIAQSAPSRTTDEAVRARARRAARRRRRVWMRRGLLAVLALLGVGLLVWAFLPEPVAVDLAAARQEPMQVAIVEDGLTRVAHRYVVSAPIGGSMTRISLRPGDPVDAGAVIARISSAAPPLLDVRTRAEAEARLGAAQARLRQARAQVERAHLASDQAQTDATRLRDLAAGGAVPAQRAEQAEYQARAAREERAAAEYGVRVAEQEVAVARAVLAVRPADVAEGFAVTAPVAGRVLRVYQESATVVLPGAPLIEIGDPDALEIVIDVLSSDAVRVRPGAAVRIEQWGGDGALAGRVRRVEPAAFTRVSALGIEEQRVNVIAAFEEPPARYAALGDGYRVEASILEWEAGSVLAIPASAVFRHEEGWATFVVDGGKARLTPVTVGRQNEEKVEIRSGLDEGTRVVTHPSDRVADGTRVQARH